MFTHNETGGKQFKRRAQRDAARNAPALADVSSDTLVSELTVGQLRTLIAQAVRKKYKNFQNKETEDHVTHNRVDSS